MSKQPGTMIDSWTPSYCSPDTKEQVLKVLEYYASKENFMPPKEAKRCHYVLTTENPKPAPPVLMYGSHLGGWAFSNGKGVFGYFDNDKDAAKLAAKTAYANMILDWVCSTGGADAVELIVREIVDASL